MKISIEVPDEITIKILTESAETILWHINNDINKTKNYKNGQIPDYVMQDIRDNFKHFEDINKMINYFGGTPVELKSYNVKFGYDVHGKKYQQDS
jgi:hypothetical protein